MKLFLVILFYLLAVLTLGIYGYLAAFGAAFSNKDWTTEFGAVLCSWWVLIPVTFGVLGFLCQHYLK